MEKQQPKRNYLEEKKDNIKKLEGYIKKIELKKDDTDDTDNKHWDDTKR